MSTTLFFVGLDLGAAEFYAALGSRPWKILDKPQPFANTPEGFHALQTWLVQHGSTPANSILCMEATGVYGEALAYWLVAQGYPLAVEAPLRVKRAFKPYGAKSDRIDSRQIAEYAYRFEDELTFWQPRAEVLEQIQVLLTAREQLVKQSTAHQNSLHALTRKAVRTPVAEAAHERLIAQVRTEIKALEQEVRRLIDQEPPFQQLLLLLLTIPGVGLLLSGHMLVLTRGTPHTCDPKRLAAHIGICPLLHESGKSVRGPATGRGFGPGPLRKLLHLAARSVCTHDPVFRAYYERKLAEGKSKRVIFNNVANKLLKVMCAVLRAQTPYDPNYAVASLAVA